MDVKQAELKIELVSAALKNRDIRCQRDCHGRWMLVKAIRLGGVWNKPESDILLKFFDDNSPPVILVPDDLQLRGEEKVCSRFLEQYCYLPGWRRVCPSMFQASPAAQRLTARSPSQAKM